MPEPAPAPKSAPTPDSGDDAGPSLVVNTDGTYFIQDSGELIELTRSGKGHISDESYSNS